MTFLELLVPWSTQTWMWSACAKEWLRIADERQTAVVACEQFAGLEVF